MTILVVAGAALLTSTNEPTPLGTENSDPATTIEAYVTAYNAGDIEGVMALFSEESVIADHPAVSELAGLTQIRRVHLEQDMGIAAAENAYTISNVEVTGDTVTWDHVWINEEGDKFCKFGHSAVIQDGTILSWMWPSRDLHDCP